MAALLNGCCVDLVVFSVSPDEADVDDFEVVADGYHKAVFIPTNVEDDTVIGNDARGRISRLDIRRGLASQGALRPNFAVLERRAFRRWVPTQSMGTSI